MAEQNEVKDIVDALKNIKIAIESLIPDPTKTIGDYQKGERRKDLSLLFSLIIAILALVVSMGALSVSIFQLFKK
jgi:hypothetical protein